MCNDFVLQKYLQAYGYAGSAPTSDSEVGMLTAGESAGVRTLEVATMMFQHRNGLDVTGTLNEETRNLMATPRCGLADIVSEDDLIPIDKLQAESTRVKRYSVQGG